MRHVPAAPYVPCPGARTLRPPTPRGCVQAGRTARNDGDHRCARAPHQTCAGPPCADGHCCHVEDRADGHRRRTCGADDPRHHVADRADGHRCHASGHADGHCLRTCGADGHRCHVAGRADGHRCHVADHADGHRLRTCGADDPRHHVADRADGHCLRTCDADGPHRHLGNYPRHRDEDHPPHHVGACADGRHHLPIAGVCRHRCRPRDRHPRGNLNDRHDLVRGLGRDRMKSCRGAQT
ncbi:MAG: hypothetical protein RLZZ305_1133 [Actinomycetota bacterium]